MKKLKTAIIREEYIELTGDLEKAIILNQFIYWSERVKDFDKFIKEEEARRELSNIDDVNIELQSGWIYKDMKELKDEIMSTSSVSTMSRKLDDMVKVGWLKRRNNPKHKWDKRYQYRVDLLKISVDLYSKGYLLQNYKINIVEVLNLSNLKNGNSNTLNESSDFQNASSNSHGERAISEITSKITSEITSSINQERLKSTKLKVKKSTYKDKDSLIEIDKKIQAKGFKSYKDLLHEVVCLKENYEYPYSDWISTAKKAIWEMYYYDETKIAGRRVASFDVISKLQDLNFDMVYAAIRNVVEMSKSQEIRYPVAFLKTAIFNEIDEFYARTNAQVSYNLNAGIEETGS